MQFPRLFIIFQNPVVNCDLTIVEELARTKRPVSGPFFISHYFLFLRCFRYLPEYFRLLDSELREHFPVQDDVFFGEFADKSTIRYSFLTRCRVYPDIPKIAKIALALFAPADGVHTSMHHRFHCGAVIRLAVRYKTLGALDYLFAPGSFLYASFDSGHKKKFKN